MKQGDIVTGNIEALSFGGEGIMKKDNFVLFVPFTAIGDFLSCTIVEMKKNYGRAKIHTILKKSENRVIPKCSFFGTCGGCQLQHLNYQSQISIKQQWVKDALIRIGKLEAPEVNEVIPSKNHYAYRRHISLSIRNQRVGYIGIDGHSLVQVTKCPIFIEENSLLNELQAIVAQFKIEEKDAKLTVLKQEESYILHFHFKILPVNAKEIIQKEFKNNTKFKGIILSSKTNTIKFGSTEVSYSLDGLDFSFSSDMFIQNNVEQSENIYRHLVKIAKESSVYEILDLYCGIGISSLSLAKLRAHVTGIEANHRSIKMAIKNAQKNGLETSTKFIHATVENVLEKIKIPDFVIINPPREGLQPQVILALKKRLPKKIVYISCMPSTLARDLFLLGKENYHIEECQPYDMFPQTTHIETVISLALKV